jgi:hypothetical protein
MIIVIMGHECKCGTVWGIIRREEVERKRYWGVKKSEVHFIHTYEDRIMKLTKHFLKRRKEGKIEV